MSTRSELKQVRALLQKKYRIEQGRFLVQGRKLVLELLGSDLTVDAIYATAKANQEVGIPGAVVLQDHEMERLGGLESGNELIAVARMPEQVDLPLPGPDELMIALDGVTDPGNMGTILRIADWFGVRSVLCSPGSVDVYNPKCVQASMGSLFRVMVHRIELAPALIGLQNAGATMYVADMGGRNVFDERLEHPAVLILGSESHGISEEVSALGGTQIAVPRIGAAESLNVATAASALCAEFTRQRLAR